MKPKIKRREWLLLAPFLFVGGLAFYWQRAEHAPKPHAMFVSQRGMYVSDAKINTPSGYWQEQGYSHEIQVTISHPWPRPKWWGSNNRQFDMKVSAPSPSPQERYKTGSAAAKEGWNGMLTAQRTGKTVALDYDHLYYVALGGYKGKDYLYTHRFKGNELPQNLGETTFRANYEVHNYAKTSLNLVVRKSNETLYTRPDKNTGARLVKVVISEFGDPMEPHLLQENAYIGLVLQSDDFSISKVPLQLYDVELSDARGRKFISGDAGFGYSKETWNNVGKMREEEARLKKGQYLYLTQIYLDKTIKTSGQLTFHGKFSVNEHWPIDIKVDLLPRKAPGK